ncbi:MAG: hypothetical protein Q8O35_08855 [Humidesulfovibrio sp.]|nr:hypothetical protein [Humidesulfovibrio sp.]
METAFALLAPPVRGKKVLVMPNVLRAVAHKALCIACFCCQEMRPEKAIAQVAGQVAG